MSMMGAELASLAPFVASARTGGVIRSQLASRRRPGLVPRRISRERRRRARTSRLVVDG